ncbi:hydroxymethylglutaryl-coenzyme A reductase-domain-containing protein [Boletus reticuloceps]|uniref:hydroxymethylglutaryl-CoA reductase (NADPH) n=1 Tax=Boletus reticuloceps TaxID=495285 RepID=A0A8I2YYU6_9AGAM|nr:hydroxymethylglutaryl-coenzyme A reductase-domain-containing protein [Boletus reticuloceps]
MRVPLLPLTGRAVYSPIETIVSFFVIGTLAYFRILFAIKHSSFFAPVFPSTLSTTHALLRDGQWVVVDEERYLKRTLDPQTQRKNWKFNSLFFPPQRLWIRMHGQVIARSLDWAYLAPSISNLTHHISDVFVTASGQSYSAVCFHPSAGGQCFTEVSNQASGSQTVTLSFVPGAHEEFVDALKAKAFYPADSFGVQYRIQSLSDGTIGGMKSGKWIAYAASALISRFWELAKKADSLDILLVLAGYILMHASFIRLFLASRALGSNFWLTTAIVSSSILSFILALPISHYLEIPLDPISLTEALPFLVCTVGFDKQLRLAKAIFNHPHLTTPVKEGRWRGQMKPAGEVVFEAMGMVGNLILRDYGLEIAALLLGARSKVGGLMEFCALAALSLVLDCLVFGTFYAAVLTIMVEVRRIQTARVLTRSRSTNNLTAEGTVSALARSSQSVEGHNLHHKFSDTLLGIKGSMLRDKNSPPTDEKEQDPVARLKLLLLVSFLTLHILNFTTTLAPATIAPFELRSSLRTLAAFHTSNNFTTSSVDVLVKVAPPLSISVIPPGPARPRALFRSSEIIDNFMSGWTNLVGDPVISKWIVFVLAASVVLNGYLLKGIAEGAIRGLQPPSVRFRSVGAVKRDRNVDEEIETPQARSTAIRRKPSFVVGPPKPKPGDSGATNTPESVPSPLLESKHLIAPTPIPASKEISGVPAFLLDMKLRVQPTAIVTKEPHLPARSLEECIEIFEHGPRPVQVSLSTLNDEEIILLAQDGKIAPYALEKVLGDLERAVLIRRALISRATPTKTLEHSDIPMASYDYSRVFGACCGGVTTVLTHDAMTRGPAIDFPSIVMAAAAKAWVDSDEGYEIIREAFESTSRFAKLQRLKTAIAGRTLFVRFATKTGDAMGMNMISKGTEKALEVMKQHFPEMVTLALSGNYCTDKKPAAINWIEGRGKGVVAEAIVPGKVVKSVLKTTVEALCNLNIKKNLVGSAMAGAIGGFNAHAANILTAIFLATGQDPAQNVESSNCITLMEPINDGEDLLLTVSMPCIEVGTVGGGTVLAPQGAVLEMLGIKGAHLTTPGMNAQRLARIIAASVMAGELSLLSALAAGHLVRAHLVHNRSQANTPNSSRPVTPSLTSRPIPWEQPPCNPPALPMQVLSHSSSTSSLPPYSESKP